MQLYKPVAECNAEPFDGPQCRLIPAPRMWSRKALSYTDEEAQDGAGLWAPGMATIGYVSSAKEKADCILGKRSLLSARRKPTSAIKIHAQTDCTATTDASTMMPECMSLVRHHT